MTRPTHAIDLRIGGTPTRIRLRSDEEVDAILSTAGGVLAPWARDHLGPDPRGSAEAAGLPLRTWIRRRLLAAAGRQDLVDRELEGAIGRDEMGAVRRGRAGP